jgi:hypothetical protein
MMRRFKGGVYGYEEDEAQPVVCENKCVRRSKSRKDTANDSSLSKQRVASL